MKKRLGDLIMSCLFMILGLAAIFVIQGQSSGAVNNTGSTTFRSFPVFYGFLIILFSGINIALILIKTGKEKRTGTAPSEKTENTDAGEAKIVAGRTLGMFLLSLAFALLLKKIHFALLCFCFLFSSFLLLGQKRLWLNALVAAAGSGFVYLVFVTLLKLPL